jgi:hypothetical protein
MMVRKRTLRVWIVVYVIQMPRQIRFIANEMFPKPPLPQQAGGHGNVGASVFRHVGI